MPEESIDFLRMGRGSSRGSEGITQEAVEGETEVGSCYGGSDGETGNLIMRVLKKWR